MSAQIVSGAIAAANAASSAHGMPPVGGILVCGGVVAGLVVRSKLRRASLRRSYVRAMSRPSAGKQIRAFEKHGVLRKAHAAGRAKWAVRKAVAAAIALGALVLWVHGQAGH